jgi:predicted nucleotidyltransferase component of viral defense system
MKKQLKIFIPKREYINLLTPDQKIVFKNLSFTSKHNLYLAGGTALMFYLGHRTSVDFDFYSKKEFGKGEFIKIFKDELKFGDEKIKILRDLKNTCEFIINNVRVSCFYYFYPLIGKINILDGILIASLQDLAAMKALAIGQRGTKRDFIDIYYLIRNFGLKKIIFWTKKKYPEYSEMIFLKGLTYFEDIEKESIRNIQIIDKKITWGKIKKEIIDAVREYQLTQG